MGASAEGALEPAFGDLKGRLIGRPASPELTIFLPAYSASRSLEWNT
jgi:hypothetical protein